MTLKYELTADTEFLSNKVYYTRSGAGTTVNPYVYSVAEVTIGETIPANTYYEVVGPTGFSTISWLPEDFTGKATTNYVQDEVHKSETTGSVSRFVIVPAEGAFYDTNNLKVVYHTSTRDTVLTRDSDYKLVGVDYGRTKISSCQGGVYHFIVITSIFIYDASSYITISYQAFGGYLSSRAYTQLVTAVANLESKLSSEGIITADNITSNESIRAITTELQALCARLLYAPSIKYLAKISSGADTNWTTFAVSSEDYDKKLDFNDPTSLIGMGVFTFFSREVNMKVALSYDLTQKYPNTASVFNGYVKADVQHQSLPQLDTSIAANDSTFFTNARTFIPKFRVAFDTSDNASPKLYLQVAFAGTADRTLDMIITDSTDMSMDDVANKYVLTEDTTFQEGKTYYIRTGTDDYYRYTKADVTVGATVPANTYYECTKITAVHNVSIASKFALCQRSESVEPPSLSEGSSYHNFSKGTLALKDPFKIWEGNVNLAFIQDMSYQKPSISEEYNVDDSLTLVKTALGYPAIPFCPKECLDASLINYIIVDVYDRWEKKLITSRFPAKVADPYSITTYVVPKKTNANGCYFVQDLGYMDIDLTLSGTTSSLSIYSKSGKSSYVNQRFDLRAIYIC